MVSDPFYRRRERAIELGFDIDKRGRAAFMQGYDDGYSRRKAQPFPPRPGAYRLGFYEGKADANVAELSSAQIDKGAAALADSLKNVRRTATRRLDEAGVPDDKQGNTEGDW